MPENIRQQMVVKHQRWILFLRHCAKCQLNVQECQLKAQCKFGKELWQHILHCASPDCGYARCKSTKALLTHYQRCKVQVRHLSNIFTPGCCCCS